MLKPPTRIIGLIDMDCFYAQVEQREKPELWGKPVAVVQPSGPRGALGGVIALSYEARRAGVKRGMMVPQVKACCSEVNICVVPFGEHADKPDINKYRLASAEVFEIINTFDERIVVEKASVDEAFLDLTQLVEEMIATEGRDEALRRYASEWKTIFPTSHLAEGADKNDSYNREESFERWITGHCATDFRHLSILVAGEVIEQLRAAILSKTQFYCSGGVATNKMMAKLVCGRHKPRQQTLMPHEYASNILDKTSIQDVRFLGGKFGQSVCNRFGIETMGQLAAINLSKLEESFPAQARWLYEVARGHDEEVVKTRNLLGSVTVSKQFPGKRALAKIDDIQFWITGLSKELCKRLHEDQNANKRTATSLILSFCTTNWKQYSKTLSMVSYNPDDIYEIAWGALKLLNKATDKKNWEPPLGVLTLSSSRFVGGVLSGTRTLKNWMKEGGETSNIEKKLPAIVSSRVDDQGWEVFNPDDLEDVNTEAVNAPWETGLGSSVLPNALGYDPAFLNELPEDIRAELLHEQRLNEAKVLQVKHKPIDAKVEAKGNPKQRQKKKADLPVDEPPKKKIKDFFKKD
ncbi:unnamed protein product, partial [Mesorhabditis belari]|uniref:DNA polymerase eta n=1 Tax=Mesorhabditis belari TaxID=2138241 RepID=A0AAF3E8Q0_9BILA